MLFQAAGILKIVNVPGTCFVCRGRWPWRAFAPSSGTSAWLVVSVASNQRQAAGVTFAGCMVFFKVCERAKTSGPRRGVGSRAARGVMTTSTAVSEETGRFKVQYDGCASCRCWLGGLAVRFFWRSARCCLQSLFISLSLALGTLRINLPLDAPITCVSHLRRGCGNHSDGQFCAGVSELTTGGS